MRLPEHTCLNVFLDFGLSEIEWTKLEPPAPKPKLLSKREIKKLRQRSYYNEKRILADWLNDAKARSARFAALIAADEREESANANGTA
ncbi:MAG TPA: hypothetical protein VGT24_06300 [Candidatus Acidoferrales bacterium]|nr:hypothetical protein [Candidatus Acidoferrales bacterium]